MHHPFTSSTAGPRRRPSERRPALDLTTFMVGSPRDQTLPPSRANGPNNYWV